MPAGILCAIAAALAPFLTATDTMPRSTPGEFVLHRQDGGIPVAGLYVLPFSPACDDEVAFDSTFFCR